jgi:hypothetical protein
MQHHRWELTARPSNLIPTCLNLKFQKLMKSRYQSRRYEHSVLLRFLGHVFNSKIFMVSDYTEIVN